MSAVLPPPKAELLDVLSRRACQLWSGQPDVHRPDRRRVLGLHHALRPRPPPPTDGLVTARNAAKAATAVTDNNAPQRAPRPMPRRWWARSSSEAETADDPDVYSGARDPPRPSRLSPAPPPAQPTMLRASTRAGRRPDDQLEGLQPGQAPAAWCIQVFRKLPMQAVFVSWVSAADATSSSPT